MKRDMELIRRILLETETLGIDGDIYTREYKTSWFEDVQEHVFYYHVELLDEAGYIRSFKIDQSYDFDREDLSVGKFFPVSLTWEGHEFLDSIRNNDSWERVKRSFGKALSTIPVSVLANVTTELTKEWALKKVGLK